jgi:hypothetical protein
MAYAGDVLLDPSSGRRLIFRRTSAQTRGRLIEYALHFATDEQAPEPNVHLDREHVVEVVVGALVACVGGRLQRLRVGEVQLIDRGEAFAVWNPFPSPAAAVWQTFPALDTEAQLEAGVRP